MSVNFEKYVYYDSSSKSGLRWRNTKYVGRYAAIPVTIKDSEAGTKKKYWYIKINNRAYTAHRVIMHLLVGFPYDSDLQVDHIDGNSLNNCFNNLRIVTSFENNRNSKMRINNNSGLSGIYQFETKGFLNWRATVTADGRRYSKSFSVLKYGEMALELAKQWRLQKLEELESRGIFFSERHGKIVELKLEEVLDEATKQAKIKAGSINEKKE